MKSVAIHQPNYLPWIGYFYKIWASNVFIIHDDIEYSKHSFTKRVYIREAILNGNKTYLSVPVKKHSDFIKIKDLKICFEHNWQKKHLNKIYNAYHKAPYYNQYAANIITIIKNAQAYESLSDLNQALIREILRILDIKAHIFLSSELPPFGLKADKLNAALVEYVGGTTYLSGQGGKKYQSEFSYTHKDISIQYNNINKFLRDTPPQYPAIFDSSLSILDMLFFIGKEGILDIFKAYSVAQSKLEYIH